MSAQGWIKFEKALREDIRVKRMAAGLAKLFTCNGAELQRTCAVTLVLGGLAQLWMHADTFARDDDTLEIGTHEIDELTGIEGFAKLMPPDWLEILDAESVKLPGFQGHNGVVAKRRALVSKRVSKHRTKVKLEGVTHVDEPVTHDGYQTRLDHTKTRLEKREGDAGQVDLPKILPPAGLDQPTWARWLAYRQKIKKPIKPPSMEAAQKSLAAFGSDQAAVVEQSIAQGWQGLFALKRNGNGSHPAEDVPTRTWRPSAEDDEEIPHVGR